MEQRCHLAMIWLTWLGLPLLAVVAGLEMGPVAGVFVLAVGVVGQILYIRWFPRLSAMMGYGPVTDAPARPGSAIVQVPTVTLYTANVCPFCPIIRKRLAALQRDHAFELREVDVTFRPDIIRSKGLTSVPVLEANGQLLVGNATSARIVEFLAAAAGAGA